jgi:hypothetical protein
VVLSSGFLAFAQHAGFLQAVEEVSRVLLQPRLATALLLHTQLPLNTVLLICSAGMLPVCW